MTPTELFNEFRLRRLLQASEILQEIQSEAAQIAFSSPSDVLSHPRAQDYGRIQAHAESAENAISKLLVGAEVYLKVTTGLFPEEDEDE
jgi:hypothetical protein